MPKKKRGGPTLEEVLARPWCYYCERDFDDMAVLISHQKAKHFKCERCGRRLNTAGGLVVHLNQVHKESLEIVENALPNRQDPNIEIFGLEGVPEDILRLHNERLSRHYMEQEAQRRASTGNPPSGQSTAKRPKLEDPGDLKKRLAEHKAKKAAEAAAREAAANAPPSAPSPAAVPTPSPHSPAPPDGQNPFTMYTSPPPSHTAYAAPPVTYPQPNPAYATSQPQFYQQQPPTQWGQGPPPPPFSQSLPAYPPQAQYPTFGQSPSSASPPPFPYQQPHVPTTQGAPAAQSNGLGSPGLPAVPGLPQKPSFPAPNLNPQQMQYYHNPTASSPPPAPFSNDLRPRNTSVAQEESNSALGHTPDAAKNLSSETAPAAKPDSNSSKKPKISKEKLPAKLVYTDNDVSPEEKMAAWSRFSFKRAEMTVVGAMDGAGVTGPVDDS